MHPLLKQETERYELEVKKAVYQEMHRTGQYFSSDINEGLVYKVCVLMWMRFVSRYGELNEVFKEIYAEDEYSNAYGKATANVLLHFLGTVPVPFDKYCDNRSTEDDSE